MNAVRQEMKDKDASVSGSLICLLLNVASNIQCVSNVFLFVFLFNSFQSLRAKRWIGWFYPNNRIENDSE